MTDQIIKSNQSSVILLNLEEQNQKNLSYNVGVSYPILAKHYVQFQADSGGSGQILAGKEIVFKPTKGLLVRDAMIQLKFTLGATVLTQVQPGHPYGERMFEYTQMKTNSKVISTLFDSYITGRVSQSNASRKLATQNRMRVLLDSDNLPYISGGVAASTIFTMFVPLYSSFFETVNNAFDLNFYEQLSIVGRFNGGDTSGFGGTLAADAITLTEASLWCWLYRPDEKAYDLLRAQNQKPEKPLTMLCYNTHKEPLVCTSKTTNKIRLNTNYPVFNTYIEIRGTTTGKFAIPIRINKFTFKIGGTALLENIPHAVANWESESSGGSTLNVFTPTKPAIGNPTVFGDVTNFPQSAVVSDDGKVLCLNWGMEPHNRVTNTGAVSFAQINFPELTLETTSARFPAGDAVGDYTISVTHEYWNVISLDSVNGSVNIVQSS